MNILIIPTVREIYENQFEYSVDERLIKFISAIFNNSKIEIFSNKLSAKYDLIVLAGGNNSIKMTKADILRNKINNLIYNFALKKKIYLIGICHGALFLGKKNNLKLQRKNNHLGNHNVIFNNNKFKINKKVNSYHSETLVFKKTKKINLFGIAEDNTVEAFHVKDKRILGIIWHPERYKFFKKFDKELIRIFYATNSTISG